MDFFQQRYYRITKVLMSIIGQWPYQTVIASRGCCALAIFLFASQVIPVIIAVVEYRDNRGILLDCTTALFYTSWCIVKLTTFLWNSENMLKILTRIRGDWLVWENDREVKVLHKYAERARKFIILYTVTMYSIGTVYVMQPVIPKIIDVVLHNVSKPGKLPIPVYYCQLDTEKYYFYIAFYTYVCVSMVVTISTAYDVMLIAFVQHGCAIFAAVGNKLERIGRDEISKETKMIGNRTKPRNETREDLIISCIVRHNDAIEYAALIDKMCAWSFFATVILRIAIVTLTGLQIVTKTNDPQEIVKFMAFASGIIFYVYMESYLGQDLMDHSISIRCYIQNGHWYRLSLKAQKLLHFMTMRCNVPCQLTAGKMLNVSVDSFTAFLRTSMSYLTVLRTI